MEWQLNTADVTSVSNTVNHCVYVEISCSFSVQLCTASVYFMQRGVADRCRSILMHVTSTAIYKRLIEFRFCDSGFLQ